MKITKVLTSAFFVSLLAVLLTACGSSSIDLRDYVSVEFKGANGYGSANVRFDEDALASDLMSQHGSKIKKAAKGSEIYEDEADAYADMIAELFYVETDAENLSNNDKVRVEILFDGSLAKVEKNTGLKFSNSECEFTVDGLGEVVSLDVFENLDVQISGISPSLTVKLAEKEVGKYGFYVTYRFAQNSPTHYKIGDTLNIEATFSEGADLENGYIAETLEKSIVITSDMATAFVTQSDQLTGEFCDEIRSLADVSAAETFVGTNDDVYVLNKVLDFTTAESIGEPVFYDTFFSYSENPGINSLDNTRAQNCLLYVYKIRVNNALYDKGFGKDYAYDGDVYGYVAVSNITKQGDVLSYSPVNFSPANQTFESEEAMLAYFAKYGYTLVAFDSSVL